MMCAKCGWYAFPSGRGCEVCSFALCSTCFAEDEGLIVDCPREEIVLIAKRIGAKFAGILDGNGLNLTMTSIHWRPDLGEIRPSFWRDDPKWDGVRMDDGSQVLHKGVRLIVRLSPKLRQLLHNWSTGALYPGETDEVISSCATMLDLKNYGKALSRSEAWTIVTNELKNRAKGLEAFEDNPGSYELTLKLISFEVEQVIYQVGAMINSYSLAAKGSFRGECGFSFGMRKKRIHDQLQAAGATLE
jgi:hypothetical protein